MHHLTKIIAFSAAAILSGVALVGPGAAPARAAGIPGFALDNYLAIINQFPETFLYAHAHNYYVQTNQNQSQFQWWDFINRKNVRNLRGQNETAWEIQLEFTGQCLNDVVGVVYLDSCQVGDQNELYWQIPSSGAGSVFTYANVAETRFYDDGYYFYMTAPSLVGDVFDQPFDGAYSEWYRTCVVNC